MTVCPIHGQGCDEPSNSLYCASSLEASVVSAIGFDTSLTDLSIYDLSKVRVRERGHSYLALVTFTTALPRQNSTEKPDDRFCPIPILQCLAGVGNVRIFLRQRARVGSPIMDVGP